MAHILAKITLNSGRTIKVHLDEIKTSGTSVKWTNSAGASEKLLWVKFDDVSAITVSRRWF